MLNSFTCVLDTNKLFVGTRMTLSTVMLLSLPRTGVPGALTYHLHTDVFLSSCLVLCCMTLSPSVWWSPDTHMCGEQPHPSPSPSLVPVNFPGTFDTLRLSTFRTSCPFHVIYLFLCLFVPFVTFVLLLIR